MAAVMREYENDNDTSPIAVQDGLKTMKVLEVAWESSTKHMTPI